MRLSLDGAYDARLLLNDLAEERVVLVSRVEEGGDNIDSKYQATLLGTSSPKRSDEESIRKHLCKVAESINDDVAVHIVAIGLVNATTESIQDGVYVQTKVDLWQLKPKGEGEFISSQTLDQIKEEVRLALMELCADLHRMANQPLAEMIRGEVNSGW